MPLLTLNSFSCLANVPCTVPCVASFFGGVAQFLSTLGKWGRSRPLRSGLNLPHQSRIGLYQLGTINPICGVSHCFISALVDFGPTDVPRRAAAERKISETWRVPAYLRDAEICNNAEAENNFPPKWGYPVQTRLPEVF